MDILTPPDVAKVEYTKTVYTMLFIELFVHDTICAHDADECKKTAFNAAVEAANYFYAQKDKLHGR